MLAVLLAPVAMPICFRMVLSFYVKEPVERSAPLLPGYERMLMYLSLLVTIFIGLPTWLFVRRRCKVTTPRAIIFGVLVGLAAATMYLQQVSWAPGVLLWTGG